MLMFKNMLFMVPRINKIVVNCIIFGAIVFDVLTCFGKP